jgi:simple sugar transport system ATP-binding protein
VLRAEALVKRYGHVEALRGTDFDVSAGEVVGLIGDNGAGKTTLVKLLSGNEQPDDGRILFDGDPIAFGEPAEAKRLGIETVYQDLSLAEDLDAAANLFLGRELRRAGILGSLGVLDDGRMRREASDVFGRLGVDLTDARAQIASLSGGQRQGVAVARAVHFASRVIFMDEPTAALGVRQSARVLDLIRRVSDNGVAVVLISHNMHDVLTVCDHIHVLRLGQRVARFVASEVDHETLVAAMTGGVV